MYPISVKNITSNTVTIQELGFIVEPGETQLLESYNISLLRSSIALVDAVVHSRLSVMSDTGVEYTGAAALDLVRGGFGFIDKGGALRVLVSDRPDNYTWMLIGRGDDVTEPTSYYDGDTLEFDVPPQQFVSKDFKFLDDIYLRGGVLAYQNAALGSYFDVEIVAPAGTPYPSYSTSGNLDFDGSNFTPNVEGTGAYNIVAEETVFTHFIKRSPLLGTQHIAFTAQESHQVPYIYHHRITVYNASASSNLELVMSAEVFRSMLSFS